MATSLTINNQDLYKEMRSFLLGLFPDAERQIIQTIQNNQPLPESAITMQVLFDSNLDESVTTYNGVDLASVQNSVEVRFQLDFYGDLAEQRSRIVYNVWKNHYGTDNLIICQPLYVHSRQRVPYVNDSNQYEDRFILDLALQYNPSVIHAQDFTDEAHVTIRPEL